MKNQTIISALAAALIAAAAFYAGMQYQNSKRGNFGVFRSAQMRQFGQNSNIRPIRGDIISTDDKSITVKLNDGSSKIILLSDSTSITEATSAAKQTLQSGKQVFVFGTENSDGSVTAQNIQLNPQMRR